MTTAFVEQRVFGGRDTQGVDDPVDAMAKLNQLRAELRRAEPASDAQAFSRTDPRSNLAAAERRRNRPLV